MRVQVGKLVDISKDVNLVDLAPMDRIISAASNAYYNTALYRRRFAESEEKKEEARRKIRESLVNGLLTDIQVQLAQNSLLREKGDVCRGILVKIPPRYTEFINDAILSHEFDAYTMTVIPPSRSLCKWCAPPKLLYIESKGS